MTVNRITLASFLTHNYNKKNIRVMKQKYNRMVSHHYNKQNNSKN